MKILIIRLSSLGDIILTTPILRKLRQHYRTDTIHFLTKPQFAPILDNNPNIDRTITYDKAKQTILSLAKTIRKTDYDLIIDLQKKLNTAIIKLFNLKSSRLTYKKKHFRRWLLTEPKLSKYSAPIKSTVDLYAFVLEQLNLKLESNQTELFLASQSSKIMTGKAAKDTKKIILAPGAKHFTKRYPPQYFSELITLLKGEFEADVILVGSTNEVEISQQINQGCEHQLIDLTGKTDLQELFGIIQQADLFISGDTGPMHIAAALKIPQIAIFGSTHPKLGFAPLNEKALIIQKDIECRPCSLHGRENCPQKHFRCMRDLKPAEIFSQIKKII